MVEVSIIGIDLSKNSFQVHGARADGSVAFRRKLSRGKVPFLRRAALHGGDGGVGSGITGAVRSQAGS